MTAKTRVTYRRARVLVEFEKAGACAACGLRGRTEMHHYFYSYNTDEVRRHPHLALDNTIELCFLCHRLANMLRYLAMNSVRTQEVNAALLKKLNAPGTAGKEDTHERNL